MFNIGRVHDILYPLVKETRQTDEPSVEDHSSIWVREGITLLFNQEDMKTFYRALGEVWKPRKIQENFTPGDLEDRLQEIVAQTVQKSKYYQSRFLRNQLKSLHKDLRGDLQRWTFVIPTENLTLENRRQYTVAGCRLYEFTEYQYEKHRRMWLSNVEEPEQREKGAQVFETWTQEMRGRVCIEVEITAVKEVAKHRAHQRAREAISLLSLYRYGNEDHLGRYIGLQGETEGGARTSLSYVPGLENYTITPMRVGPMSAFELDPKRIEYMEKNRIKYIGSVLQTSNKNDLERKLATAVFWNGKALNIPIRKRKRDDIETQTRGDPVADLEFINESQRFLMLFTALEGLLLRKNVRGITRKLAERVAYILADDPENRERLYDDVRNLYSIRGDIVHEGEPSIPLGGSQLLANIVRDCILSIARLMDLGKVSSMDELDSLVKAHRLE